MRNPNTCQVEVAINMKILGFYQKWKNHNKHSKINTFKEVIFKKSSPNWVQDHFLIEKRNITIRGKKNLNIGVSCGKLYIFASKKYTPSTKLGNHAVLAKKNFLNSIRICNFDTCSQSYGKKIEVCSKLRQIMKMLFYFFPIVLVLICPLKVIPSTSNLIFQYHLTQILLYHLCSLQV